MRTEEILDIKLNDLKTKYKMTDKDFNEFLQLAELKYSLELKNRLANVFSTIANLEIDLLTYSSKAFVMSLHEHLLKVDEIIKQYDNVTYKVLQNFNYESNSVDIEIRIQPDCENASDVIKDNVLEASDKVTEYFNEQELDFDVLVFSDL